MTEETPRPRFYVQIDFTDLEFDLDLPEKLGVSKALDILKERLESEGEEIAAELGKQVREFDLAAMLTTEINFQMRDNLRRAVDRSFRDYLVGHAETIVSGLMEEWGTRFRGEKS